MRPSDIAIKVRKKMRRRVEILEVQEFDSADDEQTDHKGMQVGMEGQG